MIITRIIIAEAEAVAFERPMQTQNLKLSANSNIFFPILSN